MAQEFDYHCTICGKDTKRDLLTAKKVLFVEMGAGGKTIRARVIDWMCPSCVKADPVWQMEPHQVPTKRGFTSREEERG